MAEYFYIIQNFLAYNLYSWRKKVRKSDERHENWEKKFEYLLLMLGRKTDI